MRHTTILTVTNDAGWLAEMRPTLHGMGWGRLVVADSVEEAARLLDAATPRLILVRGDNAEPSPEQLASLLWANSILESPAAVAIVAEEYDAERATAFFQLGVDEYLAMSEHADRAATILLQVALSRPAPRPAAGVPTSATRRSRVRTSADWATDHVAVA